MSQQDMDLREQVAMAIARYDWHNGLSANGTPGEHVMGEADAVLEVVLPLIEQHRQAVAVLAAERDESTAELMRAATAYRDERDASEASRRDWAAEAGRQKARVDAYLTLLDCVYDDTPCRWDHNHTCQAHGFPDVPLDEPCPQTVIGQALAAAREERKGAAVCSCVTAEQADMIRAGLLSPPLCAVHPEADR